MINLIQPITVQQAYNGTTHARWWASWNWWWRKVDDDDGDGFPSPEPRTDSRSALPREFWSLAVAPYRKTRWFLLSNFFLPESNYIELELTLVEPQGAHEAGGAPQGGGRAPTLVDKVWPPWRWFFRRYFLYFPKSCSVKFQVIPRMFVSAHK